jgi:hypothetical protein
MQPDQLALPMARPSEARVRARRFSGRFCLQDCPELSAGKVCLLYSRRLRTSDGFQRPDRCDECTNQKEPRPMRP